jgi:hypothetical protein
MPFNELARKNAKIAIKARAEKRRAAKQAGNDMIAEVCSVNGVRIEDLPVEAIGLIKKLQADLDLAKKSIPASERLAVAAADMQGGGQVKEVFTGKYVTVQRCKALKKVGYSNNHDILEPEWKDVELPIYAYKVELAPAGGLYFSLNGHRFYHGMVAKFDLDTLRSVKEIVARGWEQERLTSGKNENAYRPKENRVISARG